MGRKNSPLIKGLSIICCCFFLLALMVLLYSNRREEQRFIQEINGEAAVEEQKSSDTTEMIQGAETPEEEEEVLTDHQQSDPVVEEPAGIQGISFRGDSFCEDEDIQTEGLGACMKEVLEEQGKETPVQDYTMYEAGSMSHMKLAGVSSELLSVYLSQHQELAKERTLRITEVKIRDLTEEQMVRTDQEYIPVICVGYYGGWVGDLDELCEQQQKILDTYQQKEKYLILGIYPAGFPDKSLYRDTLAAYWGEHFICVDDQLDHSITSSKGKQETAQMVYDKLVELGYID